VGGLRGGEGGRGKGEGSGRPHFEELVRAGRAGTLLTEPGLWIAAERLPMLAVVFPGVGTEPAVVPPERERAQVWTREDAVRELVRGRLEAVGPTTAAALAAGLGLAGGGPGGGLAPAERGGFGLGGRLHPGP